MQTTKSYNIKLTVLCIILVSFDLYLLIIPKTHLGILIDHSIQHNFYHTSTLSKHKNKSSKDYKLLMVN